MEDIIEEDEEASGSGTMASDDDVAEETFSADFNSAGDPTAGAMDASCLLVWSVYTFVGRI